MAAEKLSKKERRKIPRQQMPEQDAQQRARNFEEVNLGLTAELARLEATRCLECKNPKCEEGCPVNIHIQEFVTLVAEDHIPVRLKLMDGGVEVTVSRQDVGAESEHLKGDFSGSDDEVSIAFNPRYLQDGVTAILGDKVRIQVIDSFKPSILDDGTSGDFLYLLMPVRV